MLSPAPYSQTPAAYVPPSMSATKFHTHTGQRGKIIVPKGRIAEEKLVCKSIRSTFTEAYISVWP